MEDLYIVTLVPDEFDELVGCYENFVEWCKKEMTDEQKEVTERVLTQLHEADTLNMCLDEQDHLTHSKQVKQFSRDDVARIVATILNTVLGKLLLPQIVHGIAMLPAGEGLYLIDVVLKNLAVESTWSVYVIIPSTKEETDGPAELNKEFSMTSITKADLVSAGFSVAVVEQLTDSDMQHIASAMEDLYCDTGFWEDLKICTKRTLEYREEQAVLEQNEQMPGGEDGLTGLE